MTSWMNKKVEKFDDKDHEGCGHSRFGRPLTIDDIPIPDPGLGELLVKVIACGVCHTDLHAADGHWPVKPHVPIVPGHEVSGAVAAASRTSRRAIP